ncbi:MAG: hypothetical protein AAF316_17260 [Cyanobacteria bacterium P01_A01_bin.80]
MQNYRLTLKRVGAVLIAVGILKIAYILYLTFQGKSHPSWSNILFLIAGIVLFRGNLRAVPIVRWFAALSFSTSLGSLILLPFIKPLELWIIEFHLNTVSFLTWSFIKILEIALSFWVYLQLRSVSINRSTSKSAFIFGFILIAILSSLMYLTQTSTDGIKAVEIARSKYGETYKYHITAMEWSGGRVRANISAYNRREVKPVKVEWEK